MPYHGVHPQIFAILVAGSLALQPSISVAQVGALRGVVTDSAGVPIPAADVSVVALDRVTRTDEKGLFAFEKLPQGGAVLSVRRMGYQPQTVDVVVNAAMNYLFRIELVAQATVLGPMSTNTPSQRLRLGLEDFYRRRKVGLGTYFTRDEILAQQARTTSDVFRSMPGIQLVPVSGGHGVRLTSTLSMGRNCIPLIWIDGQHAEGLEVDDIPVNDIQGIEFYRGPATTPPQFWRANIPECGTIVIWSRTPPP